MQLRFVPRDLAALDELDVEVLVATVFSDVRPAQGVAALCDWRLGGRLSGLMREGFVTGERGEVVMVPGKPQLAFDKVLLFGVGPRDAFGVEVFTELVRAVLRALVALRVRSAVVELPGRSERLIDATEAADIVLAEGEDEAECDAWTLVEDVEARAVMEQHAAERRRRRRVLTE